MKTPPFAPRLLLLALVLLACALRTPAQAVRVMPAHPGSRLLSSNLSLGATPASLSFNLAAGLVAQGSQPIVVNTSWTLGLLATVHVYAYFLSETALSDGTATPNVISASSVLGQCSTGSATSYTAFTQSGPFSSSSLLVFQQTSLLGIFSSRSDNLYLKIDLRNQQQLPAGAYSGTLTFQAQAF